MVPWSSPLFFDDLEAPKLVHRSIVSAWYDVKKSERSLLVCFSAQSIASLDLGQVGFILGGFLHRRLVLAYTAASGVTSRVGASRTNAASPRVVRVRAAVADGRARRHRDHAAAILTETPADCGGIRSFTNLLLGDNLDFESAVAFSRSFNGAFLVGVAEKVTRLKEDPVQTLNFVKLRKIPECLEEASVADGLNLALQGRNLLGFLVDCPRIPVGPDGRIHSCP